MTTPTGPQAQEAAISELLALSERASVDWRVGKNGSVVGGPFYQYTNGSAQSQLASFSIMQREDDAQEQQQANAEFAVALVAWFRTNAATLATPARMVSDAISGLLVEWRTPDDSVPVTEANIATQRAYDACARQLEAALSTLQSGAEGKDGCVLSFHPLLVRDPRDDYTIPVYPNSPPHVADALDGERLVDPVFEWRWIDEKGRAMTNWKRGEPPPMSEVSDGKGTMRVEIRAAIAARADEAGDSDHG